MKSKFSRRIQGIQKKMSEVYKALYATEHNVLIASVSAYFPLMDKYGNTSQGLIYRTLLPRTEASKINWDVDDSVLKLQTLPAVWSDSFIHSSLQ